MRKRQCTPRTVSRESRSEVYSRPLIKIRIQIKGTWKVKVSTKDPAPRQGEARQEINYAGACTMDTAFVFK